MMNIEALLGEHTGLLSHQCRTIKKEQLYLPGPDFIDTVMRESNRRPTVVRNLSSMFNHGRLAHTGYVSILPVDQGIEHSAGASFAPNPITSERSTAFCHITGSWLRVLSDRI